MYCPNCGKQNEDDAKFCAHCGADMTPAEDTQPAQPVQPTPTAIPPQPTAPAAPPVQPTPPPVAAAPAPPPASTVPPAPVAGEPAKKGSSKCWLIGCGILLALIILAGIGTWIVGKRVAKDGAEVISQIQTEIEDNGGLVINEGGDDGSSSSSVSSDSGSGVVADAPAAAVTLVENMFAEWTKGNAAGVKRLMTTELTDEIDDDQLSSSYKQVSFEFTGAEEVSSTEWAFVVHEEFRPYGDDDAQSAIYRIRVVDTQGGWKISALGQD